MGDDVKKDSIAIGDFKRARDRKKNWITESDEDYEFAVGKQWTDDAKQKVEKAGRPALTINKVQPNLYLLSGLQRQNRTDYKAYPEGDEDSLTAEVVTLLLKNVIKRCNGEYKISEIFEDGIICGEGWLEPYIDYTFDLLNGEMKLKKLPAKQIFADPDSIEYDLSDAEFLIKFSPSLTKKHIIRLFPDKKSKIENLEHAKLTLDATEDTDETGTAVQSPGYDNNDREPWGDDKKDEYDLTEYYYKKDVEKFVIADKREDTLKEATDEDEAKAYVTEATKDDIEGEPPSAIVLKRIVPEIWVKAIVGMEEFDDYKCPFFPRWKTFPLIPYFAHRITTKIKDTEYMTQGIVRSLKDPQREFNKRRSQELAILNTSANSGWLSYKGAWVKKSEVKKFGATPGAILEWKGENKPEKITPTQLSQGHAQAAAENSQDMKELSGINADLLALNEKTQSGRAIHLRQQQGVVMVQRVFDNLAFTKKILGRFLLSQLGELYTVDIATKVCGTAFVKENFSVPVMEDEETPVMTATGEMQMELDQEGVAALFNQVLNDPNIANYDIAVGEGANTETVKYANYMILMELQEKGIPIPPDVLVDESLLSTSSKGKIKQAITQAMEKAQPSPAA